MTPKQARAFAAKLLGRRETQKVIRDLADQIDALTVDAKRYRLLRKYHVDSYIACGSKEVLDGEIDSAVGWIT